MLTVSPCRHAVPPAVSAVGQVQSAERARASRRVHEREDRDAAVVLQHRHSRRQTAGVLQHRVSQYLHSDMARLLNKIVQ